MTATATARLKRSKRPSANGADPGKLKPSWSNPPGANGADPGKFRNPNRRSTANGADPGKLRLKNPSANGADHPSFTKPKPSPKSTASSRATGGDTGQRVNLKFDVGAKRLGAFVVDGKVRNAAMNRRRGHAIDQKARKVQWFCLSFDKALDSGSQSAVAELLLKPSGHWSFGVLRHKRSQNAFRKIRHQKA